MPADLSSSGDAGFSGGAGFPGDTVFPGDTALGVPVLDGLRFADPDLAIEGLAADGRLVHVQRLPARDGRVASVAEPWPDKLAGVGPTSLWSHQAEAIDHIRAGRHTVIATGTASGKSLCYQLPIAESIVDGLRPSTSLLIYPTKALAQDQLRAFGDLGVDRLTAVTYDGDASRDQRTWARSNANVLLTNPEMVHHALLPHHTKWATFFKRLRYVVIDELHVLRGIFGTNLAHVMRRLQRIAGLYGAEPTFVLCSATIGDPATLASEIVGRRVTAVTADGSPQAAKAVALVQPALRAGADDSTDVSRQRRVAPATEAIRVVSELVSNGLRVITFCSSRAQTERVAAGVQRSLPPELADTVRPYRAGYLAAERREIEAEVAAGSVRAVIATSALELGIDIGGLDATVLVGFPGTIASFWQQVGRAGRRDRSSLAVLVAGEDQLDQWFMSHPQDLFERPPEPAVVNVANPHILDPHLGCAAYEYPLTPLDERWWPDVLDDGVRRAVVGDDLKLRPDRSMIPRAVWSGRGMPFHRIGLRSTSIGEVRIVAEDGRLIGTVEAGRAPNIVHPGAVYLHRGQPWKVEALDLHAREAVVTEHDGSTWTSVRSDIAIEVLDDSDHKIVGRSTLHIGAVRVTTTVTGYRVHKQGATGPAETHDLDLPPSELETRSIRYEWDPEVLDAAGVRPFAVPGALHAAEHAGIGILPLFTICDRWDVGGVSIAEAPQTGLPSIFIYDGHPGGAGIAELAFAAADRHLAATVDVLRNCNCTSGCPSCVQSPKCGNGNEPLDKHAALALLTTTLGGTDDPF